MKWRIFHQMAATICPAKSYKSEWGDLNSQYGIPNAECYPVTPHSVNLMNSTRLSYTPKNNIIQLARLSRTA